MIIAKYARKKAERNRVKNNIEYVSKCIKESIDCGICSCDTYDLLEKTKEILIRKGYKVEELETPSGTWLAGNYTYRIKW